MLQADRDLSKLTPSFRKKVELFLKEVEPMGVFITEAYRSKSRQLYLRAQGLSRVITSYHQKGLAVDIAFKDDARTEQVERELYPKDFKRWREVADIAKKYQIDWGYDLWKWDKPHLQDNGKSIVIKEKKPKISKSAQSAVRWAIKTGVATGWKNPEDPVQKQWMAVMLKRTHDLTIKEVKKTLNKLFK